MARFGGFIVDADAFSFVFRCAGSVFEDPALREVVGARAGRAGAEVVGDGYLARGEGEEEGGREGGMEKGREVGKEEGREGGRAP